jgi:hypothetical protein
MRHAHPASADARPSPVRHHGCPEGLVLRAEGASEALYAARQFEAGEPVFQLLRVTWRAEPDRHTLAHPHGGHLFDPLLERIGRTREPNCRVALELMAVIARRDIAEGEAITIRMAMDD